MMSFHRIWHDDVEEASLRLFRTGELDEKIQDMVATVAAIKGAPQPQAGAQFVASLREQLMAEALQMAVEDEATEPEQPAQAATTPPAAPVVALEDRTQRLRRLARVAGVVAAGFVLIGGTELVTHLRDTGTYESGVHPDTMLPHPHPR